MTESDYEVLREIVLADLDNLSSRLTYHSKGHTIDVIRQSIRIAQSEGINESELLALKIAALFHDIGFLRTYVNHEMKGCEIFLEKIKGMNFSEADKELIQGLIMATKLPQQPHTLLQQIICDADLDYLGREDFFGIGEKLKREFIEFGMVADEKEWDGLQVKFLKNHRYHTHTSRKTREPIKQKNYSLLV